MKEGEPEAPRGSRCLPAKVLGLSPRTPPRPPPPGALSSPRGFEWRRWASRCSWTSLRTSFLGLISPQSPSTSGSSLLRLRVRSDAGSPLSGGLLRQGDLWDARSPL